MHIACHYFTIMNTSSRNVQQPQIYQDLICNTLLICPVKAKQSQISLHLFREVLCSVLIYNQDTQLVYCCLLLHSVFNIHLTNISSQSQGTNRNFLLRESVIPVISLRKLLVYFQLCFIYLATSINGRIYRVTLFYAEGDNRTTESLCFICLELPFYLKFVGIQTPLKQWKLPNDKISGKIGTSNTLLNYRRDLQDPGVQW